MNNRLADVLRKLDSARQQTAVIQRDYREAGVTKRRLQWEKWASEHPERIVEHHKRSGRKRAEQLRRAVAAATPADLQAIEHQCKAWKESTAWRCAYCHKDAPRRDRVADHVVPLSRGGLHAVSNLAPACRRCNSRKGTRSTYYA